MDLQKAYDTIEWVFLDDMLKALKFREQFGMWIMQCVTTATYSLNLNDDLLLFCKGDVQSIMTILRTFSTFSKSSGLNMSKGKSNAYFNGVNEDLRKDILQVSGLVQGNLPFRYLGVPIKTTRLNAQDCAPLIDKLMNRIRGVGTRKLSYAGRLVLVQSVLKTLHNYWAAMFILANGVISKVESICRNFLWDGRVDYIRTPLVSWEKNLQAKKRGRAGSQK
ncbi:uncharacterized protein LOC141627085 [Silene latifolia]|uniref:uncharacterized protein LOC141627085 n=1 Tax=Silene latifolia TaxID=37657 RepID=UPI003D77AAEB